MSAIPTNVSIDDKSIIASGFALMTKDNALVFTLAGLRFEFVFLDDEGDEPGLEPETIDSMSMRFRLKNFKNPIGSSFGPIKIGNLQGQSLSIGVYVCAVGDNLRAVSYCLTTG